MELCCSTLRLGDTAAIRVFPVDEHTSLELAEARGVPARQVAADHFTLPVRVIWVSFLGLLNLWVLSQHQRMGVMWCCTISVQR